MATRNDNVEHIRSESPIIVSANLAVMLDTAFVTYYDDVRASLRRRARTSIRATEIVHDLYILLSGRSERLAGKTSLRAYLIRAAHNLGIDRARRRAFEQRLFTALDSKAHAIPAVNIPIETRLDLPKRVLALKRAIFALPPQCRNVFIAHRIAGMEKAEIATALGIGKGMVDRHLRKAMLHCLEKWKNSREDRPRPALSFVYKKTMDDNGMVSRLNSAKKRKLRAQAVDWLLLMEERELSSTERAALDAWLAESADHAEAFDAARTLYRDAAFALAADPEETKRKIGENGAGLARGGVIIACLVVAGGLFWLSGGPLYLQADVISQAGEKPVVVLADGSRVHLNSGSAIAHEMSGSLRRVELLQGEAFFEVARDAARPFVVEAGGGRVEVLGTAFNVNIVPGSTEVTVTENRVRVSTLPGQFTTLTPGMRVRYDTYGRLEPVQTVPVGMETPWLAGRLVFEERPLAQVVAEIARYLPGKVTIPSKELAGRRISGSFDLSNPEAAFASFAGVFGLRTIRAGSLLTIIY